MIGGHRVINLYEGNQSLHYNQDEIENEPLNSQLKKQDPAVNSQKMIKRPKIVIGLMVMLLIVGAGIGILVSQILLKGDYERLHD